MFAKPLTHPVTGDPLPRRPLHRREQWNFVRPWLPANGIAAGVPAAAIEIPPWLTAVSPTAGGRQLQSTQRGAYQVKTAATIASVASIGLTDSYGVNGLLLNNGVDAWHAVGVHFAGYRMGAGTSTNPTSLTGLKAGISLADAAKTSGFTIQQTNGDAGASLVVHGDATYPLYGGSYNLDILSNRSAKIGALFDPVTKEAIVYTLDHLGRMEPVLSKVLTNVVTTAALVPRMWVEATTAGAQQLQVAQVTVDIWT